MDGKEDPPPLLRATALRRLRWKRRPDEGPLFGVCAGLARHIGWKPRSVRLVLVISSVALAGTPVILYLFAALAIPADGPA